MTIPADEIGKVVAIEEIDLISREKSMKMCVKDVVKQSRKELLENGD